MQYRGLGCDMKTAAIILSGGSGKRFGAEIPKQYIEIGGRPVLSYTIEAFEKSSVDEIVIVAAEAYAQRCRDMTSQRLSGPASKVKAVITGGKERYDSVLQGLRYIMHASDAACVPELVLIHDGARPLIRPETIDEVIRCTREYGAAIAATPCTDTIKIADQNGNIADTTERSLTWAAQTPQAFYTREIFRAYEEIIGNRINDQTGILKHITDDAMVFQMEFPDRMVHLVNAGAQNFKITAPEDLDRAELLLRTGEMGEQLQSSSDRQDKEENYGN